MINLGLKLSAFLMVLTLGTTSLNAENAFKELSTVGGIKPNKRKELPQNKKAYTFLQETKDITSVEVSPDNKHVLVFYYSPQVPSSTEILGDNWGSTISIKKNFKDSKKDTDLKVYNPEGAYSPSWTPDSKGVSYISRGDKVLSLWFLSLGDFKPRKILELDDDIMGYRWSPDGQKLAILLNKKKAANAIKEVVEETNKSFVIDLYILDVDKKRQLSNLRIVMPDTILPLIYGDNNKSLSWTPDSQQISYNYYPLAKGKDSDFAKIDLINLTTKKVTTLTEGKGTNLFPYISPDGKSLAYITDILPENAKRPIYIYGMDSSRVCLVSLQNLQKRCLAKTPNENPTLVGWKQDGKSLFVVDQEGNTAQIYELGVDGKSISKLTEGAKILSGVQVNPSGEFIGYVQEDFQTPREAYISSLATFNPEKMISFSKSATKKDLVVEKVKWKSKDKKFDLEGVLIYPKATKAPLPLIVLLNDYLGNAAYFGYVGNLLSNYPISLLSLLQKGYALFIPNRRGTNGYGVEFRQALYKDLGDGDFQDVMSGIDVLIATQKVDPNKLALWGWGQGGYLCAQALAQSDRFKTIIVGAGIADLVSHYGTTNDASSLKAIMGGPYWTDWKTWREKSPISHVKNMKTPTLIQCGQKDEIVDKSQSEELYFPLRSRGIPTQMIMYKDQGHSFSNLNVILLAIQDLETWLDKYFSLSESSQETERL